jgi:hypothetical protein
MECDKCKQEIEKDDIFSITYEYKSIDEQDKVFCICLDCQYTTIAD